MCPEYGATIAIFPIDEMTLDYLRLTGRDDAARALVEAYAKAQGLFRTAGTPEAVYTETLELDLGTVEPSLAGPRRPQDRVSLRQAKASFEQALARTLAERKPAAARRRRAATAGGAATVAGSDHGAVVIAAITSCTNTSNPSVMIGAGLLAKKAVERGLQREAVGEDEPGARLEGRDRLPASAAGLTPYLEQLGFNLVGYGCTTCIGNSGRCRPRCRPR